MILLNERLKAVAQLVPKNAKVIDVGCDHAYLSIYLKQYHIATKVVASDNKEGPLREAQKNIKREKADVETLLADGVSKIPDDIDTVVVSGMGGGNIIGMFKYTPEKLKNVKTLVLSPNNDLIRVRKEISKLGFYIEDETLVKYKNIIYVVMKWQRGKRRIRKKECIYGPILAEKKGPLFQEYLSSSIKQKELLLKVLPKKYWLRRVQIQHEIKMLKDILK